MLETEELGTAQSSVERVYRTEGPRLWRAIVGYSGDPTIADDVVAETFAQLLRRGDDVRDGSAWVWRAAFKIAAGELKRGRQARDLVAERVVEDPEPVWELVEALSRLSDQQRAVVLLRDYVGHSGRATAEMVGSTEQSVRVQLSRARRALRKELSR